MSFKETEPCYELNSHTEKVQYSYFDLLKKPIEIYLFIDPICPESWALNPYIKKLQLEYGQLFTMRPIVYSQVLKSSQQVFDQPDKFRHTLKKVYLQAGKCLDCHPLTENRLKDPANILFAVKAAELQGNKAGRRYLDKVQENLFLGQTDTSIDEALIQLASEAHLDVEEFQNDLHSTSAKKALQCDLKLSREMEIDQTPSIVFFSESEEDEGLKISGSYSYDIYVRVLTTLLQKDITPFTKPDLEEFISYYRFISSEDIAIIYDWNLKKTEREMKKLQLKQIVSQVSVRNECYWRYNK